MANPIRHVKKKKIRDLNRKIDQVRNRMHNKKAKRDVPRLQAELNSLFKQKDEAMRGNLQLPERRTRAPPAAPRLCSRCSERLGKGYHICKEMPKKS